MKRLLILVLFSVLLFSLISVSLVISEDNQQITQETTAASTTSSEGSASTTTPTETSATTTNTATTDTASAQTDTTTTQTDTIDTITTSGDSTNNENKNTDAEFNVDPGMTPDNPLYFVKDTYQRIVVGNDPEKALDYREQKIAEAKAMVEKGNEGAAEKSLDRALKYGDIVEKEVNPELKDEVQQRSEIVQNAMRDLRNRVDNQETKDKFDENINKEKEINSALELVAKINELCNTLAKIDPLQYADNCKPKDSSPKWMKEKDKELTKEQQANSKVFVEKLSQCFENPENCDCRGMGVQSFEDFCVEKNALAIKCKNGDENSCIEFKGTDPSELLPDYLVSSFRQVESKYMKSEFDMYVPEECVKTGAKTPEECNKIMFKLDSPQECIDAGLTGKSQEDEIKCKKIMFEKNPPKECIDSGIKLDDPNAPRKCAKIMFEQRSPQECFNAGITGERRDDEKRCRELMISIEGKSGKQNSETNNYSPKFNRDCNSVKDSNEKMKCYEEFYNNAQVQVKDDFRQREFKEDERGTREFAAKMGAANPDRPCPDGVCDQWEKEHPNDCPEDCGGVRRTEGNCQTNEQIERLKQDCKNRGQDANVETRGGCPWVICIGGAMQGINRNQQQSGQQPTQNQQGVSGGQKCPDNICDEYERMNPYACPEDCGGSRPPGDYQQTQSGSYNQQQPGNYQQPNQQQNQQVCSGQAPSCAPNGAPYCQNGNWICPQPPQQQQEQIIQQPQQTQQPLQEQQPQQQPEQQPAQQTAEQTQVQQPVQEQQSTEPPHVTGGVVSVDDENNINNQVKFWDYWFVKSN